MGSTWGDPPRWRQQGRTGPGPIAPRYARHADRSAVRHGRAPARHNRSSGSGGAANSILWAAIGLLGLPLSVALGVATWLLHGYGVI